MNRPSLEEYAQHNVVRFFSESVNHDSGPMWFNDNYDLAPNSHVIEVGGFTGEWTGYMSSRYGCFIDVYEPVREYAQHLIDRFSSAEKIRIFQVAVDAYNGGTDLYVAGDRTSTFPGVISDVRRAQTRDIEDILARAGYVDLLALNCEGGEYPILERAISAGRIDQVRQLVVQFHTVVENAEERRNNIREALSKTHKETFCYPFVWEIWKLK